MGVQARRVVLIFQLDYCDKLFRVLVKEGVHHARDQDINTNPTFVDLYWNYLCEMMYLIHCIVKSSRILEAMRDAGHAVTDTLHETSRSATSSDHDDEGGDDDASGMTTP